MNIIQCNDSKEVALISYRIFKEQLIKKPNSTLGLATGSTPILLYNELIKGSQLNEISFKKVNIFNLDEYVGLNSEHKNSYAFFMKEYLLNFIEIEDNHFHIPNGTACDLIEECHRYNNLLSSTKIDLQLLGLGENGHIGFNEPNTSFDSTTHLVELTENTRKNNSIYFKSINDIPTHAITMGISNIINATKILLLAIGENKAEAVYNLINGPIDVKFPGSILRNHPDVTIILDKEAATLINKVK